MSNAALYFHPGGYDTSGPELLGRLSAGESFLRGYLRHADVEQIHLWNVSGRPQAELETLLERIEPPSKPVTWIPMAARARLGELGVMNMPVPGLADEAWHRRPFGPRTYAICGITHTTATARVMRTLTDMLIAPTEGYDALICTSDAVRHSVETQLTMMRDYLGGEYGPRRRPEPMRVTIPLGINVDDFATSPEHREAWRGKLGIPDDAVVALFLGRFTAKSKMNPALMALALEAAAKVTGRKIAWVMAGWGLSAQAEEIYHKETAALCPSVQYIAVDGRLPDVRFSIWSVGDFFISFSDNIQETFGLTPVEAMAAGLPSVVSDWDGYKGTVRHGVDGFRVPTMAPPPGTGADFAHWYANQWVSYDNYVGGVGQSTVVDLHEAQTMISALVVNPDLRRLFGAQARERARAVFDWAAVIPQYQALWAEQNARRLAAPPQGSSRENPLHPDPFTLFQSYPTAHLSSEHRLLVPPGMDWSVAAARLEGPLASYSRFNRPSMEEAQEVTAWIAQNPMARVADLVRQVAKPRQSVIERGLLWLARYGVIRILPPA